MQNDHFSSILKYARRVASRAEIAHTSDRELLSRFVRYKDDAAFTAILHRHGGMVYGVCRRVVDDPNDADDAFQAAFLVLIRKAAALGGRECLASWLQAVAWRLARKVKVEAAHRKAKESRLVAQPPAPAMDAIIQKDLRQVLDEELNRLPEKYRAPLILCYLEGRSYSEAARNLGWAHGTVCGRMARARDLLRQRLTRRGLVLSTTAFTGTCLEYQAAPAAAVERMARAYLLSQSVADTASTAAVELARNLLRATALGKLKTAAALIGAICFCAASVGWAAHRAAQAGLVANPVETAQNAQPSKIASDKLLPRTDLYGDPLPTGAVGRLGTLRYRHPSWVSGVAFTPDGKTLASACWDGGVRLWDSTTGKQTGFFGAAPISSTNPRRQAFLGVTIAADGKKLIALSNSGAIHILDPADGKELQSLKGASGFGLALSPDGKTLAIGLCGGEPEQQIALWDVTTGQKIRTFGAANRATSALAFSPDGKIVAAGDSAPDIPKVRHEGENGSCSIRLWDAATGQRVMELKGHTGGVTSVAFAPDGQWLVSSSYDGTVRFWNPIEGKEVRKIQVSEDTAFPDLNDGVRGIHFGGILSLAYSPNGLVVAAGGYDRIIRLLDARTGRELHALRGHGNKITSLAFSKDGTVLASGSWDFTIRTWDPATGAMLQLQDGQNGRVINLAVSRDGRLAASAGCDGDIALWSLATGRQVHVLHGETSSNCRQLAFSLDGSVLIAGSMERPARGWDTKTGREIDGLPNHSSASLDQAVHCVAPLPQRNSIITARTGDTLRVWDWATGKETRQIQGIGGERGIQISFDGAVLAAGDRNAVNILDAGTGNVLRRFDALGPHFGLSPDGRILALHNQSESTIHLRSVATGEELGALTEQDYSDSWAGCSDYVFSPDGRILARVGRNRTIELWDVLTAKLRRRFPGHQAAVAQLAFTPDGETLLSGSDDTTILIWDVTRRLEERPGRASDIELERHWAAMADNNAAQADRAICALAASAEQTILFLERNLRPAKLADEQRITRLITALDSDKFAVRDLASQELETLGRHAEASLRQALKKSPSLEIRRRVEGLLVKLRNLPLRADLVRELRATEVLERIGTPEATRLLKMMASGAPEARLTSDARASLERLAKRPSSRP